jgi:cell wall-associated NlpC family hydrolase
MIEKYLSTKYVKGGRGPVEMDCWGLVRTARADIFGRELLPAFDGISPDDKKCLTEACDEVRLDGGFIPVEARAGAIATAWTARLCVHVGLVVNADGRMWVLETDEQTGPCLTPIQSFESRYTRVVYYDN